jgi:hypothetical protein
MRIFKVLYIVLQFILSMIYFFIVSVPLALFLLLLITLVDIVKRTRKFFNKLLT